MRWGVDLEVTGRGAAEAVPGHELYVEFPVGSPLGNSSPMKWQFEPPAGGVSGSTVRGEAEEGRKAPCR